VKAGERIEAQRLGDEDRDRRRRAARHRADPAGASTLGARRPARVMEDPEHQRLISLDLPLPGPAGGSAPVWILLVSAEVSRRNRRALFALLDERERHRAWEIRAAERRAEFIAGHGWRRVLLSSIVHGAPPAAWRFATGTHGRPLLVAGNGLYDTSLSHAAGAIAVAVAVGCRVGVDIELAGDASGGARDAGTAIEGCASLEDWTLAESVGKCLGEGVPDSFEIRRGAQPPPGAARVSLYRRLVVVGGRRLHLGVAAAPLAGPPRPA
jgi:hypothetical protein